VNFVRYGEKWKERPCVLDPLGRIRDIGHLASDIGGGVLTQLGRFDARSLFTFHRLAI
jgi:hypothetical protein